MWDWAQIAGSGVALVWGWRVQRKGHREKLLDPPTPTQVAERKRDETRRTPGLIAAGRGAALLAAPVLPALAAWAMGWVCAAVTVREYPSEVAARRAAQEHRPAR
ncbi:hypothetical protein [Streptomyces silvisoli]|uniref:Uncharacterized protein n=1 Tax=Streptomyces silvisoli TaxID=3034235 RepID=A0ABT5ZQQ5_9ACTN|nr:hypothetical protein [Streptomyces silvisoli]MDF3292046.1 hypothetical protein [Streptomyces silvisoli]